MIPSFLLRVLVASVLSAAIAAPTGTMLAFGESEFFVVGIAHAALAGVALGILLEPYGLPLAPLIGSVVVCIAAALFVAQVGRSAKQLSDEAVAAFFTLAMGIAVFLMYLIEPSELPRVWGFLLGDPLLLTDADLLLLGIVSGIVVLAMLTLQREFVYVLFDEEGMAARGVRTGAYYALLLTLSGLAIAVMVRVIGAILVYAIVLMPAIAARRIERSVGRTMRTAFLIAIASQLVGIGISLLVAVSPTAIAAFAVTAVYVASLFKQA